MKNKMKLQEAKQICSYVCEWQFLIMGVKERAEIELNKDFHKYSLADLIQANKLVEQDNRRKRKTADYHRSKGHNVGSISLQMTLADRLIAAIYCCLHFQPNGEMVAILNDRAIGVVKPDYEN